MKGELSTGSPWLYHFHWRRFSRCALGVGTLYGSNLDATTSFVNCNWHASRFQVIGAVHGWQAGRCLSYLANHHIHPCTLRAFFTISIIQGRAVGVAHYLLGGIVTTWAFFARPRTNAQVVFSDPSSCGIANFKLGAISIAPNLHPRSHGHIVHHTPSVLYGRRSWSSSTIQGP